MQIMVRLAGELVTKSRRVRSRFQQRLIANIGDALRSAGLRYRVRNEWSRLFVESEGPEALELLCRVFGIHSVSAIERECRPELEEIVRVGAELYRERVRGRSFAVRAHRSGKHPFASQDVNVQLGAALAEVGRVDLVEPDVTVEVEVRPDRACFYSARRRGPGGLPLGVEGRAVALISGGFDSAVAAWLMLKRGAELDYIFCNLAGAAYQRSVLSVAKVLADGWSYGSRPRMHVVDFQPIAAELKQRVRQQYVQLVLKRLMYRVAERVGSELGAHAIITGESVGQVSSQTLANLQAIDDAAGSIPVLRPLVGMDKEEIVQRSRAIGTYALSAVLQEYCALVPDKPVTAAKRAAAQAEEQKLDLAKLDRLAAEREVIDLRSLRPEDLVAPYIYTKEIPDGAVVIDCRPAYHYDAWHYPDSLHIEVDELLRRFRQLDKSRTYILYCPFGVQSAVAAERMQREGYQVYSFLGGTEAVRKYAMEKGLCDTEERL